MTTQGRRLAPVLLLVGCSLLVTSLVWSTTLQFTPTFMTLGTCLIWTVLQLRYAPQELPSVFGILMRCGWIGLVTLGAWWAINHVHP
jgi:hypothetical protein